MSTAPRAATRDAVPLLDLAALCAYERSSDAATVRASPQGRTAQGPCVRQVRARIRAAWRRPASWLRCGSQGKLSARYGAATLGYYLVERFREAHGLKTAETAPLRQ
jgi:hypothetical protein